MNPVKFHEHTILIVDDSPTQLITLEISLSRRGFKTITARNGIEGVTLAYNKNPDLIISDIMMPELNGYQLCRLLKDDPVTSSIPIILLTSLDLQQDRFWGLKAGANRYVHKDADLSNLLTEIEILLKEKAATLTPCLSPDCLPSDLFNDSATTRANYILDRLLFESTITNETKKLANLIYNRETCLKGFFDLLGDLIDYTWGALFLANKESYQLHIDLHQDLDEQELDTIKEVVVGNVKKEKNPDGIHLYFNGPHEVKELPGRKPIAAHHLQPLGIQMEYLGNVSVFSTGKDKPFDSEIRKTMDLLVREFSMVVKLMFLYEENHLLSITDGLTGLFNHRYFYDCLEKECEKALKYKTQLSLMILDIDHFKSFNDNYGHQQGDRILTELASLVKKEVREPNSACRYGGEEFSIILPETEIGEATQLSERLRVIIENHNFSSESKNSFFKITTSFGICDFAQAGWNKFNLIKCADLALYQAKNEGRNRICQYSK